MRFASLTRLIRHLARDNLPGPVALVVIEDPVEIASTLRHHLSLGFGPVIALMPPALALPDAPALPDDLAQRVLCAEADTARPEALCKAANALVTALPGRWIHACYNAEYLFYPFCETRSVTELLDFHTEERRGAMTAQVVDLYAPDLTRAPGGVCLAEAHLDRTGYYALARAAAGKPLDRQYNFYGGLRWRYEEHVAPDRRRTDRVTLFRARRGLRMAPDHTFNDPDYNTVACPWHHNLTATVCSFRAAKALKANPGSTFDISTFKWHNSVPFDWTSHQLLDLGLMEPGQWF